jgi:ribosome-binding protein aMBF1 (putative translation factor)
VIHADLSRHGDAQPLPEGFVDIDDLVTEHERNPARRAALEEGRRAVARNYYGDRSGLAVLRLQKGWSQRKLADVTGMKQPHIARLERGQNDPSLGTMRRLASALGVELAAIVRALDSDTMGAS